jgi:hypothetical protein
MPHLRQEYTNWNPVAESFIDRIEYYLFNKAPFNSKTILIYQRIKNMGFATPIFRYNLLIRLSQQLGKIGREGLPITNNELERLLWFVYREYPYERETRFEGLASDHTLRLFEMHEFMSQ